MAAPTRMPGLVSGLGPSCSYCWFSGYLLATGSIDERVVRLDFVGIFLRNGRCVPSTNDVAVVSRRMDGDSVVAFVTSGAGA